ncbi:hypothetical protein LCER1_G001081 [Lachnellula cervina]|uniref:Cupin 2 conserved barrel domain-containing protein n=1 Tax=Lachnellula cervina TaxID=1316786 RepID=A0A7D8YS95_9HELO|nr:hypothetical protein LCER1_G001081 [Lachnellula cervina]
MRRTNTTNLTTFVRPTATMTFSSPPGSSPITTITLPPRSTWTSGLHWHETHTEFLRIISGHAWVSISGISRIISAADGHLVVPKFARHEWRRAVKEDGDGNGNTCEDESWDHEELVVEEWTEPFDGMKEVFFRNLNSVILDTTRHPSWWMDWWLSLQLFVVFAELDNYPVVWPWSHGRGMVQYLVTHFVLGVAQVLGRLFGARGVYEEYTPSALVKKGR